MFLLCELDDENYTSPCFSQFNSFKNAFDEALVSCGNFKDDNMRIDVADNRNRISANTDDGHFFVTEIKEFDEKIIFLYGITLTMVLVSESLMWEPRKNVYKKEEKN